MATFSSNALLAQLQSDIRQILVQAEKLKAVDAALLRQAPEPGGGAWPRYWNT